jgi:hypothetical protein
MQNSDTVLHFGIVRAEVDEKSRTIILSLSREPTGETSVEKLTRWAIANLQREYPGFTFENRTNRGQP